MPETTWSEGAIARYLTVGGATVDLTYQLNALTPPQPVATLATCTGCAAADQFSHWFVSGAHYDGSYNEEHDPEAADKRARRWSQAHAETCRAMPRRTEA